MTCIGCLQKKRELVKKAGAGQKTWGIDRVYCINLRERKDRWDQFVKEVPEDWTLPPIIRWDATVGSRHPRPSWWKAGGGGYGCYLSHLRIYEEMFQDNLKAVLIFEDDAKLVSGFMHKFAALMENLPGDWQQFYVGGQLLKRRTQQPKTISQLLVQPYNVNRTHAYLVTQDGARILYKHLTDMQDWQKNAKEHIDHRMGRLHESGCINVYAANSWVVGQRAGKSDVHGGDSKERFWEATEASLERVAPFFPVIGLHRSGSSLLARMMIELGVHMGNHLTGFESGRAGGGSEAVGLMDICERWMRFPSIVPTGDRRMMRSALKTWIRDRRLEAAAKNVPAGAKYPHLCVMGEFLTAMAPDAKPIHITRPIADSIKSLQARSVAAPSRSLIHGTAAQAEKLQRHLWSQKEKYLSDTPHLTIQYHDVLRDPRSQVDRLIEWMEITPTEAQINKACSLVNVAHNHHSQRAMPTVEVVS